MFARIRWRLAAWTMLVLVLILLGLGTLVYAAAERTLLQQVDRNLANRAGPAAMGFEAMQRGGRGEREGYRGGNFFLLIGPNGQVLANPQQVDVGGVEFPSPAGRGEVYATVEVNDEPARVLTRPLGPRAPAGTIVVVGQSLAAERAALQSLLLVLVAGGGLGLLLSLGASWFLAGRALVPIELAFRRQQEFVADASHELRTPLTVLRSATDLLNQHRSEPLEANGELFDDIRQEIGRLQRLTGDLLTLARSDRGDLQLAVAPLDPDLLAAEVVRRLEPLAREHGVELTQQRQGPATTVEADPDRLQQVLLILLDNALQHTPSGGRVSVEVRSKGADTLIEVADTGEGIPPEHLPRVFDRFYRADPARARAHGGTGLGLAIARTLVEAHGGELTLTSAPGAGTRAVVRLRTLAERPTAERRDQPAAEPRAAEPAERA